VLEGAILLKFMFRCLKVPYCYSQWILHVWMLESAIVLKICDRSYPLSSCLVMQSHFQEGATFSNDSPFRDGSGE